MNKGIAPFPVLAELFGPPDGKTASFPLKLAGAIASNVSRVAAVYCQDWQGRQKLSPTPRTNIVYPSSPTSGWGANGNANYTVTQGIGDPQGGTKATRYSINTAAVSLGPYYNRTGWTVVGKRYNAHVWVRSVTERVYVRVFTEGSDQPPRIYKLSPVWQRIDLSYTKILATGAFTIYAYGDAAASTPVPAGTSFDVFGLNIFDASEGNGQTIQTMTGPVTTVDYVLNGTTVTFPAAPLATSALLWDGEVLASVLSRESSDLARAIRAELFGPGDGVSRMLPLKVGGSVYNAVSRINAVYRADWQGKHRLRTYERTNQCRNATALNKWSGYYAVPSGTQTGDIGPDGMPSAFSFLLNPVGNGRYAGIYDGDDTASPWDSTKPSKVGVWLRCDAPATVTFGARQTGLGQSSARVTTEWQFFAADLAVSSYTAGSNRGVIIIFDAQHVDNKNVPATARLYVDFPQLTQDDTLGRFIPTGGSTPGKRVDYAVIGPQIALAEPPTADTAMSWDGEIFWRSVASLLPPNTLPTERALEAAAARVGDVAVPLRSLWNPWTCPVELLPWLAWSLSVDTWRTDWPEHIKRSRLASAISIHRHKGTVKSVRDVVQSLGGAIEITEWWQKTPKGIPHTFDLTLTLSGSDGNQATAQFVDDVISEVTKTKPARSQFTFTQGVDLFGSIGVGTYARPTTEARLELIGS